jgi:phenylacetic acid degradation operon negative regulatory protein
MTALDTEVKRLIAAGQPLAVWSLIVTLYGDAILPRGGSVWLGTLTGAMGLLGIDAGAVRTAMSRLAADDWVVREKQGRNAYYSLSKQAERATKTASAKIYGSAESTDWDGQLHLALIPAGAEDRPALRASLAAEGFSPINPTAFAAFSAPKDAEAIVAAGGMVFVASAAAQSLESLAKGAFGLEASAQALHRFIATFGPAFAAVRAATSIRPRDALALRILLIHAFRRIVLKAPAVPDALLPADWPGVAARQLASDFYTLLLTASEGWLDKEGLNADGPLPPASMDLAHRFSTGPKIF